MESSPLSILTWVYEIVIEVNNMLKKFYGIFIMNVTSD